MRPAVKVGLFALSLLFMLIPGLWICFPSDASFFFPTPTPEAVAFAQFRKIQGFDQPEEPQSTSEAVAHSFFLIRGLLDGYSYSASTKEPMVYSLRVVCGMVIGFWLGCVFGIVLLRLLLIRGRDGEYRKGFVFLGLVCVALFMLVGGGVAMFMGLARDNAGGLVFRAISLVLLTSSALALTSAFGQTPVERQRVRATLVEDDSEDLELEVVEPATPAPEQR